MAKDKAADTVSRIENVVNQLLYVNSDIKGRVDAFKSTVESVEIGLKNQKYNSKSNKGMKNEKLPY